MDGLDSTSLNSSNSTVNFGSDLGPLGDDTSPAAQVSWDQAAADAGLNRGGGTDDMGWGGGADGGPCGRSGRPCCRGWAVRRGR